MHRSLFVCAVRVLARVQTAADSERLVLVARALPDVQVADPGGGSEGKVKTEVGAGELDLAILHDPLLGRMVVDALP